MSLFSTFKEMYLYGLLVDFEFAGIKYSLGELELPWNKAIGLGIASKYDQNLIFQIIKTLENNLNATGELSRLGNKEYLVFQYETERGQKFLIIREKDDSSLTEEEIQCLWALL